MSSFYTFSMTTELIFLSPFYKRGNWNESLGPCLKAALPSCHLLAFRSARTTPCGSVHLHASLSSVFNVMFAFYLLFHSPTRI